MMWLRKSKKGFTLVELMVVVAIIAILALLGLRLFLLQQIRAKNAIVKANTATIHTIIQGNLADDTFATALAAVDAVGTADLVFTGNGYYLNSERPAGMKNPHLTGDAAPDDLVVLSLVATAADAAGMVTIAETQAATAVDTYTGTVMVALDTNTANKFYVVGIDNLDEVLGEVYIAQK